MKNLSFKKLSYDDLDYILELGSRNTNYIVPNNRMVYYMAARIFSSTSGIIQFNGNQCGYYIVYPDNVKHKLWIHQIVIDEKFRSKGIGSRFFKWLSDLEEYQNYDLELSVKPNNTEAIKFYVSIGFQEVSFNRELNMKILRKARKDGAYSQQ